MIHKAAIVSSKAKIGNNVHIGPYSIIGREVHIENGTKIGAHVIIKPYVKIGEKCKIYQFASIGAQPQDLKFSGEKSHVTIGKKNIIREFVTIHRGTEAGEKTTQIGNNCMLMSYAHVAHDCILGNNVILANNATLAGHISIDDYVTVGGLVAIHQFVKIGKYAFIGGKSAVVKDVPPFVIASGNRANLHGLNLIGLKRSGFSNKTLNFLKKAYKVLFRHGLTLNKAVEKVILEIGITPEIKTILKFITTSSRGITR